MTEGRWEDTGRYEKHNQKASYTFRLISNAGICALLRMSISTHNLGSTIWGSTLNPQLGLFGVRIRVGHLEVRQVRPTNLIRDPLRFLYSSPLHQYNFFSFSTHFLHLTDFGVFTQVIKNRLQKRYFYFHGHISTIWGSTMWGTNWGVLFWATNWATSAD
jgi:hypothetical protein